MKIFNSDSSKEAKYLESVERKERAKDILWKHIGPYGIGMTSKFAQASLRAIEEYHTEQLHKLSVSGSLLAVRIEEALAKYWYDTEYNYIDKSDHKKAEESRARFRKWIDDNLDAFSKQ